MALAGGKSIDAPGMISAVRFFVLSLLLLLTGCGDDDLLVSNELDVPEVSDPGPEVGDPGTDEPQDLPDPGPDDPTDPVDGDELDAPEIPDTADVPEVEPELPPIPDIEDGDSGDPEGADTPEVIDAADSGCPSFPAPPKPVEFPVTIGKLLGNKTFMEVEAGEAIEIVQGPQGGVHVEVAFHITLPETFVGSSVKVMVDALSFQVCCGEEKVGDYFNKKSLLYKQEADSQTFYSGVVPVIFDQDLASFYEDTDCCVAMDISVYEKGTTTVVLEASAHHTFYCVDLL